MLFFPEELRLQLGAATIDSDRAEVAERVVWGWLKPVLGLTERPYPVPDEVFSWAIEQAFSMERRREILADAAGGGSSTAALSPRGSFPDALSYPDGTW
jgi:hypothetical protein